MMTMETRTRLWHGEDMAKEETYGIELGMYFPQEILAMLAEAGSRDLAAETYAGTPATSEDGQVVLIGRKPGRPT